MRDKMSAMYPGISASLDLTVDPNFILDQLRELPPSARHLALAVVVVFLIILGYALFLA